MSQGEAQAMYAQYKGKREGIVAKKHRANNPARQKADRDLAKKGLSPWLPVPADALPERLRKISDQIKDESAEPELGPQNPAARKPRPKARK